MVWNTTKLDKEVADFEVLGDSWGRSSWKCILTNGDYWHSKRKTGLRGVRVTFKEKVVIRSFEFQTRHQSGKFKIKKKRRFKFECDLLRL